MKCITPPGENGKRNIIEKLGLVEAELLKLAQSIGDYEPFRQAHEALLSVAAVLEDGNDDA